MTRAEFELTEDEYQTLLDASRPTVAIKGFSTPQDNANRAWAALGAKRGFKHMTVRPGRDKYHFTAESTEQSVTR